MPGEYSRHDASVPFDEIEDQSSDGTIGPSTDKPDASDPRWPTHCECGYAFEESDEHQVFVERLYLRSDTGEAVTLRDAPPGALYYADWFPDEPYYRGPDGHHLVAKLPNGATWSIDGHASNCTDTDGFWRGEHKCWVRHGDPTTGNITVDKNGATCNAGAGSILSGNYHGFLQNGEFT